MSDIADILARLASGYYNSDRVSAGNPGGMGDGGHVVNFPAALNDTGDACVNASQSASVALGARSDALGYRNTAQTAATSATASANLLLDALAQFGPGDLIKAVKGFAAGPPGGPVALDAWIVTTGTGAWTGWTGSIAFWTGTSWVRLLPFDGWKVFVQASGRTFLYRTTPPGWVAAWTEGLAAQGSLRCTVGGTANVRTLTTGLGLTSLPTGLALRARFPAANTGGMTINVDGLGNLNVRSPTGANVPAGYIRTDVDIEMVYDGAVLVASRPVETITNANGRVTRFDTGRMDMTHFMRADFSASSLLRAAWTLPAMPLTSEAWHLTAMMSDRNPVGNVIEGLANSDIAQCTVYAGVQTAGGVANVDIRSPTVSFSSGQFVWLYINARTRWY